MMQNSIFILGLVCITWIAFLLIHNYYYILDNQFIVTPNILMLQCYISTAVWLALLFLYFHKLNCGEVKPLHIFLDICFGW